MNPPEPSPNVRPLSKPDEFRALTSLLALVLVINNGRWTQKTGADTSGMRRYPHNTDSDASSQLNTGGALKSIATLLVRDHEVIACTASRHPKGVEIVALNEQMEVTLSAPIPPPDQSPAADQPPGNAPTPRVKFINRAKIPNDHQYLDGRTPHIVSSKNDSRKSYWQALCQNKFQFLNQ